VKPYLEKNLFTLKGMAVCIKEYTITSSPSSAKEKQEGT
jgi:hypothetical protein